MTPSVFAQRILDEVVSTVDGETKVDWELYAEKMQDLRVDEVEHEVNRALAEPELGILCHLADVQPCFMVVTHGAPLSPRVDHAGLCFVRREDAKAYAEARFAGALYSVETYEITAKKPKEVMGDAGQETADRGETSSPAANSTR